MKFTLPFPKRLGLLALLFVLGLCMTAGISLLLGHMPTSVANQLRLTTLFQAILVFVLPAVATAVLCTRRPAELLMIKTLPSWRGLLLAVCVLVCSTPLMEWIVELNEKLPLPQGLIDAEMRARAATGAMMDGGAHTVDALVLNVLIMGLMTGLAEELFFRGGLQRLLQSRPMSVHAAIWLAAVVFSALHGQFLGFIPRVLLGALFGYAMMWTGSLWTAVLLHALNNSVVVATDWLGIETAAMATGGAVVASAVLTVAGLWLLRREGAGQSRFMSRGM